ncbi:hypothetical protein KAZ66_01390 [Candidatus Woesebacteria bacterium]|nr:hypothetical protein [Candidatus Woesebacteria bacterium]
MKSEFFSQDIFDSYINSLRKAHTPEDKLRKSQYILEWLNWMKNKGVINDKDYERSFNELKHLSDISVPIYTNVFLMLKKYYLYVLFPILIISLLLVLWKYQYYKQETGNSRVWSTAEINTLPYKGLLLNEKGLPISTKTDIIFRIYTSASSTTALYVGACKGEYGIEPDYAGNFTVVLGSSCGMSPIAENILKNRKELYLGVQLGSAEELKPRQRISTVGYSSDAARLQGLSIGTEKQSIPFINSDGRVIFKHDDPYLQTVLGKFTIESPEISLKTVGDNGSILFQPSASGNTIVTNGKFAVGTQTPVSLFTAEGVEPFATVGTLKNLAPEDNDSLSVLNLHVSTPVTGIESSFIKFFADSSEDDAGKEVGNIRINNEGVAYETAGADFAEYFTIVDSATEGHIMSISSSGIHKSIQGETIIGVITDSAGFVGNKKDTKLKQALIGLIGQIEVLVVNTNGNISMGDKVSVSSIPGYGEKSNREVDIVGYALENSADIKKISCPEEAARLSDQTISCAKIRILIK